MALPMSRPFKHPKTGVFWLRKAVPADLRFLVGKREELRSLNTKDPDEAKRLFILALSEVDTRWANLRRGPLSLTEREAHDLAAQVHDDWLDRHGDNPTEQPWKTEIFGRLWAPTSPVGLSSSAPDYLAGTFDPAAVLVQIQCGQRAAELLIAKGVVVDETGKMRLAKAIAAALQRASLTLLARARGEDFILSPGVNGARLSMQSAPKKSPAGPTLRFDELLDGWAAEKRPALKTAYEWRRVAKRLAAFLGHDDAKRLTDEDLLRWKASMVDAGLRPKTIRDAQLAPIRAILRWAVDNRKLDKNPSERISIDVKPKPGEGKRGFTDEEAIQILKAAATASDPVLRWVPWLCAYSGARVSEVCQLRREDIVQIESYWCLRFDPEAGSLKNVSSERTIPIHEAVLGSGFLDFIKSIKSGPIFSALPPDKFGKRGGNGTKILGRWVRSLGLRDLRLAPNHSWRHRLKTSGRRYGMAPDIVDAITGHARRSVADGYGEFPMVALQRELHKIPDLIRGRANSANIESEKQL